MSRRILTDVEWPDEYGSMYVHMQPATQPDRGIVKKSVPLGQHLVLDYDAAGNLYGIEILGVPDIWP